METFSFENNAEQLQQPKTNHYFCCDNVSIYQKDILKFNEISKNSVDLIVTSPPIMWIFITVQIRMTFLTGNTWSLAENSFLNVMI